MYSGASCHFYNGVIGAHDPLQIGGSTPLVFGGQSGDAVEISISLAPVRRMWRPSLYGMANHC